MTTVVEVKPLVRAKQVMLYDLLNHKVVEENSPSGDYGFISFESLVKRLREAEEIELDEDVTHLRVERNGIRYRIERYNDNEHGN